MPGPEEATISRLRNEILTVLEQLDALGLAQAGAHLAMAIHCLEPGTFDCPSTSATDQSEESRRSS